MKKRWILLAEAEKYDPNETVFDFCKRVTRTQSECEECIKDMLNRASLIAGIKGFGFRKEEFNPSGGYPFMELGFSRELVERLKREYETWSGGLVYEPAEEITYTKHSEIILEGCDAMLGYDRIPESLEEAVDYEYILDLYGVLDDWSYFFEPIMEPPAACGLDVTGSDPACFDIYCAIVYRGYKLYEIDIHQFPHRCKVFCEGPFEEEIRVIMYDLPTPRDLIKFIYENYCQKIRPDKFTKPTEEVVEMLCSEIEICSDFDRYLQESKIQVERPILDRIFGRKRRFL